MIDEILKSYQDKLDARLDILLPQNGTSHKAVTDAARYSLLAGGKRLRPILLLEFYRLCGGSDDCAYNFACTVEMIHTYSLIHDDLPCMDDDDFRRGRPSCHKQYGEPMALLAGDALLTESFNVASRTIGIPAERVVRAIGYLSSNAGIDGMIGGQVLDITAGEVTEEIINETYLLKTGALIKAACGCGAILAGADDETVNAAAKYADNLGLAFQIIDDILDATSDEQTLGKSLSDEDNGKKTLVSLLGIEECRKLAARYTDEALKILGGFEGDTENLTDITNYLLIRKY